MEPGDTNSRASRVAGDAAPTTTRVRLTRDEGLYRADQIVVLPADDARALIASGAAVEA